MISAAKIVLEHVTGNNYRGSIILTLNKKEITLFEFSFSRSDVALLHGYDTQTYKLTLLKPVEFEVEELGEEDHKETIIPTNLPIGLKKALYKRAKTRRERKIGVK